MQLLHLQLKVINAGSRVTCAYFSVSQWSHCVCYCLLWCISFNATMATASFFGHRLELSVMKKVKLAIEQFQINFLLSLPTL